MTFNIENWEHKSGYRCNNAGKSIEYRHTERPFVAIIEGILNVTNGELEYYTVIFDESVTPIETVEVHEFFRYKDEAMDNLKDLMKKYK